MKRIIVTKFRSLASFVTAGLLPITEVVNSWICPQTQLFPIFNCFRRKKVFSNSVLLKISANCLFYLHPSWHHFARCWYQKISSFCLLFCVSHGHWVFSTPVSRYCGGMCPIFFLVFRSARTFYATFSGLVRPFVCPSAKFFSLLLSPDSSPSIAPPRQPCHFLF